MLKAMVVEVLLKVVVMNTKPSTHPSIHPSIQMSKRELAEGPLKRSNFDRTTLQLYRDCLRYVKYLKVHDANVNGIREYIQDQWRIGAKEVDPAKINMLKESTYEALSGYLIFEAQRREGIEEFPDDMEVEEEFIDEEGDKKGTGEDVVIEYSNVDEDEGEHNNTFEREAVEIQNMIEESKGQKKPSTGHFDETIGKTPFDNKM